MDDAQSTASRRHNSAADQGVPFKRSRQYDKLKTPEPFTINPSYAKFVVKATTARSPHWPIVELHFYDENGTHVWTSMPPPEAVVLERDSFYSFHHRPLARFWLPARKDPVTFFLPIYSKLQYEPFDRDLNKAMSWPVMTAKYPFVGRVKCEGVEETTQVKKSAIYNDCIEEYFPNDRDTLTFGLSLK